MQREFPAKFVKPSSDGTTISFFARALVRSVSVCLYERSGAAERSDRPNRAQDMPGRGGHLVVHGLPRSRLSGLPRLFAQVPSDHRPVARRVALPWVVCFTSSLPIGCDSCATLSGRVVPPPAPRHRGRSSSAFVAPCLPGRMQLRFRRKPS